jgi:cell division initiation protein
MRLAPIDIVNKKFNRAIRGLHPSEVADFQTEAAATMEELLMENAHLRESVESLNQQVARYARIEETLQNTLFLAQRAAEEASTTAKHEAELTLREARQQAHELLEQAQARVREVDTEVAALRRERDRFVAEFGALLQGYLTGLATNPPEVSTHRNGTGPTAPEGAGAAPAALS